MHGDVWTAYQVIRGIFSLLHCNISGLFHLLFIFRSGSVDGAFGAVRNPWQYRLRKKAAGKMPLEEQQELLVASATGSQTSTASPVQSIANAEKDCDDWFIAGGSSGGSAVAVATGAVFM